MAQLKEIIPQGIQNRLYEMTPLGSRRTDIEKLIAYIKDAQQDGFKIKGPSLRIASQRGAIRKF